MLEFSGDAVSPARRCQTAKGHGPPPLPPFSHQEEQPRLWVMHLEGSEGLIDTLSHWVE